MEDDSPFCMVLPWICKLLWVKPVHPDFIGFLEENWRGLAAFDKFNTFIGVLCQTGLKNMNGGFSGSRLICIYLFKAFICKQKITVIQAQMRVITIASTIYIYICVYIWLIVAGLMPCSLLSSQMQHLWGPIPKTTLDYRVHKVVAVRARFVHDFQYR